MPAFERPKSTSTGARGAKKQRRRWPKRLAIGIVVALALCAGGFALYVSDYYHASETETYLPASSGLSVVENDRYIAVNSPDGTEDATNAPGDGTDAVSAPGNNADAANATDAAENASDEPDSAEDAAGGAAAHPDDSAAQTPARVGIVLYPGAKVDPHAYVPLVVDLAERGMLCVIIKAPFNLAFFDIDAAQAVMADHPEVQTWWVGGHSLGGVAASQFAANHADELEGVILLASYAATDLSGTHLQALQIYGTNDLVLNRESMEKNAVNLPSVSTTLAIEGGNHAGFGAYGPQAGDGVAEISAEEQRRETADAIAAFVSPDDKPLENDESAVLSRGDSYELAQNPNA